MATGGPRAGPEPLDPLGPWAHGPGPAQGVQGLGSGPWAPLHVFSQERYGNHNNYSIVASGDRWQEIQDLCVYIVSHYAGKKKPT